MTEHMPAPPVPAEVDLRDFAFMPLDVLRLRDSDLACVEDTEVFRCAVLSWCVSWHQIPAASLPDDDALLAKLRGYVEDALHSDTDPTNGACFYYAQSIPAPEWADEMIPCGQIGNHRFFKEK